MNPSAPTTHCLNCATELHGCYCHTCGQQGKGSLLSVKDVISEALAEVVSLDGKLLRTLRLLFVPGGLTRAYIDGRRARYAAPIRVYLFASVLLFGTVSFFYPHRVTRALGLGPAPAAAASQPAVPRTEHRTGKPLTPAQRAASRLAAERFFQWKDTMFFAVPPLFGLALMAAYWRAQPFYVAHLAFALHLQAFVFSVFTLVTIAVRSLRALGVNVRVADSRTMGFVLMSAVAALAMVYLALAARRVYRTSWLSTVLKTPSLLLGYLISLLVLAMLTSKIAERV